MGPQESSRVERLDELESYLAIPFRVFVYACDRDRTLTPRSAARFQRILAEPDAARSHELRGMLTFCRNRYRELWQRYAAANFVLTATSLIESLHEVEARISPTEFANLQNELRRLARSLLRSSFSILPRGAQKQAIDEFELILRGELPPDLARAAKRHEAVIPPPSRQPDEPEGAPPAGPDSAPASRARQADAGADSIAAGDAAAGGAQDGLGSNPAAEAHPPMPPLSGAGAIWEKGALALVCVKVTNEARGVKTFSFAARHASWFSYRPGQFLTIEPVIAGKSVPRSYTISSSPTRPGLLEITVKRVPGGAVSNWLHDNMAAGQHLLARGPFGKFTCLNFQRDKFLFVSAGSGITPLMSMLRYLYDLAAPVDVIFFHSAPTEDDIVFGPELRLYSERNPNIRVHVSLTAAPDDRPWPGLRGRLDNDMLHLVAPDFMERAVLACGPGAFMDKAEQLLSGNGFPVATQFDAESFVPKAARSTDDRKGTDACSKCRIVFAKSGRVVEVDAADTILEAAERCHIEIQSSCRQGRCGTCRVAKISGDVVMTDQEALSAEDVARGDILACIGQPASRNVEVDL